MACIEPSSVTVGADLNCVYLKRSMTNSFVEGKDEFLLCSLGSTNLNAILRLYFKEGEVLHFRIKVNAIVWKLSSVNIGELINKVS